jgi:hypothetical protein
MRERTAKSLGAILALAAVLIAYICILDPHGEDAMHRAAPLLTRLLPASLFKATGFTAGIQKASLPTFVPTSRHFSNTSAAMASNINYSEAVKNRRTIYNLTKKSTISDDRLKEIVTQAIKDVPSSFNSQSTRLVVLVKEKHDQFWGIVEEVLKAIVPAEKWEHTASRLKGFQNAYGTVCVCWPSATVPVVSVHTHTHTHTY